MPPRTCALLSIGDELLLGFTADTNAHFLCRELSVLGWDVVAVHTLPDSCKAIARAVRDAAGTAAIVVMTGGLGPTADDLTREALAEASAVPLEERPELRRQIEERFRQIGRSMSASNRVQARIPRGAAGLPNSCGTAPGIRARVGEATVYALPGVPVEMREMFRRSVLPDLPPAAAADAIVMRRLHLTGTGESIIGERLHGLMGERRNPSLGITVKDSIITVQIRARGGNQAEAAALAGEVEAEVTARCEEYVFGKDEDTLPGVLVKTLAARGETLAVAESCTGGMIASMIVDIPGASDVLREGVVAYANAAKTRLLGVAEELLREHGAVSGEVAAAMAGGVRANSGATYGLATTGIAGPSGGTKDKPVGTVWLALSRSAGIVYYHRVFSGGRLGVRTRAAYAALDLLRRELTGLALPREICVGRG